MSRPFACAALWLVLFATPVVAQSTELQLGDGSVAPSTTVLAPAPATANQAAMTSDGCGCQQTRALNVPCTTCGPQPRMAHRGYYRAIREGMRDHACCADYFGGFGPLWESYCADKQRGCCASACASVRACAPAALCDSCTLRSRLPSLHLRGLHARQECDPCGTATVACDGGASGSVRASGDPLNIGSPPEPTEAHEPTQGATPSDVDSPANEPAKPVTSARRGWLNRAIGVPANR